MVQSAELQAVVREYQYYHAKPLFPHGPHIRQSPEQWKEDQAIVLALGDYTFAHSQLHDMVLRGYLGSKIDILQMTGIVTNGIMEFFMLPKSQFMKDMIAGGYAPHGDETIAMLNLQLCADYSSEFCPFEQPSVEDFEISLSLQIFYFKRNDYQKLYEEIGDGRKGQPLNFGKLNLRYCELGQSGILEKKDLFYAGDLFLASRVLRPIKMMAGQGAKLNAESGN